MFDPWLAIYPAMMAAINAQQQAEQAAWEVQFHQDLMRARMQADSIDVEARWVVDAPLLEAPKC